jgi:hypothetical protein
MVPGEIEKRPTVFVSYAQSSGPWQKQVLDFTTALRDPGGVDAELDLFHGADHRQWSTFGSDLIVESDFTLVAVDAAYRRRWLGREKKGIGAGAAREAATIKTIFETDQKDFLRRVKIVLLPGADEGDIPDELHGYCEWFRIDSFDEAGLEPLLRSIWGRPAFPKPPLGPIPALPPKAYANLENETSAHGSDQAQSQDSAGTAGSAEGPSASDEVRLRGRLKGVEAAIEHSPRREKADLQQERTALEVSLEALTDSGKRGAGVKARRPRRSQAGSSSPSPPSSPSRSRRRRERPTGPRLATTAGLVAAATVVLGFVAGMAAHDSPGSPEPITASAAGLEIKGPPSWQRGTRPEIGGLELSDPIGLKPGPDAEEGSGPAVAGVSAAEGPTLLPTAYRSQIDEDTRRTAVGLGPLQAYRYEGLKTPGTDEPVTVYAAPTSLGVATLACLGADGGNGSAARQCARIASTLRLSRGRAFPLGPSPVLATALRKQLSRLAERRGKAMKKIDSAAQAGDQAAAAESLAGAFRGAAKGLAAVEVSPESALAKQGLLAALHSARDAYKSLAVAARKENPSRYEVAAAAAKQAEVAIERRLEAMERLGYQTGSVRKD